MERRAYIAIDLKSFYASVECVARGLDPLTTNLVVADESRTDKTICLAVTPPLKACGIAGRPRLFEVVQKVKELNLLRQKNAPGGILREPSVSSAELSADPSLALGYLIAPPRMARYMEVSTQIYSIYLRYIAPEDIHVYSIDEVFIDATSYLKTYKMTPRALAMTMIRDVLRETGITATVGIGTNLYLCKIAMDIEAKRMPPDQDGVRIAELDETGYREKLWNHRPLTDFWRIGRGYAEKLEANAIYTMGDLARYSLCNENKLYRLFGINAELLIDHAWGWEPCTMEDIKSYRPSKRSLSSGQVLTEPYPFEKGRLITREMADLLSLDLVEKGLTTDQIVLTVGYDAENLSDPDRRAAYEGTARRDLYGRLIPKEAHGTVRLPSFTASTRVITEAFDQLYRQIVDKKLSVRRIIVAADPVLPEKEAPAAAPYEQMDFFTDYEALNRQREAERIQKEREKRQQTALIAIRRKYGKNAILKGMNLLEGATTVSRNGQVGGHRA